MDATSRYHRQMILPQIGEAGQQKLGAAKVLLVGCGALGGTIAEQFTRAGVGHLKIVDRDVVELTNLQRQVLFDEVDARDGTPKAIAAASRLRKINSTVSIEPFVADLHGGNIEKLIGADHEHPVDLIIDGTDNVETRYLLNDVAVKHKIPWIYGGCVGTEGRILSIVPRETACLRCLFNDPPSIGELPTCDTAGVLGPAASVVASIQAIEAIKLLTGNSTSAGRGLIAIDLWSMSFRLIASASTPRSDCPCCQHERFEFLERNGQDSTTSLCGRGAIQVRPTGTHRVDLEVVAKRLSGLGSIETTPHLLRCELGNGEPIRMTLFGDGRAIIHGAKDASAARSIYAKYVGS